MAILTFVGMFSSGAVALAPASVALLAALAACNDATCDEAHRGDSICRDNISYRCDASDDGLIWFEDTCPDGKVCVDLDTDEGPRGLCVVSGETDPRCPAELTFAAFCDGDRLARCTYGYVEFDDDCPAEGETCVVVPDDVPNAICSATAEPDPRCGTDQYLYAVCDGDTLLQCSYGFAQGESTCLVCDPGQDDACSGQAGDPCDDSSECLGGMCVQGVCDPPTSACD